MAGRMSSKKLKKYLPQTSAGLVRYYEEDKSLIQIDPKAFMIISITITLILLSYYVLIV